jgi:hypothetical protein
MAHGNHRHTGCELRERVAELPLAERGCRGARAIVGGRRQGGYGWDGTTMVAAVAM